MKVLCSVLLICSLAACKKKDEPAKTEDPAPAKAESGETAAPAEPAAPQVRGEAVDVCATISTEDIEATIGKLKGDPMPTGAQGSLLGMCNWMTEAGMASVSARTANEYDATVGAYKEGSTEVAGIGDKAVMTKYGIMIKVADKPHMLQVMAVGAGLTRAASARRALWAAPPSGTARRPAAAADRSSRARARCPGTSSGGSAHVPRSARRRASSAA